MIRIAALLTVAAAVCLAQTNPAVPTAGSSSKPTAPAARKPVAPPSASLPIYKDLKYPELRPIAVPAIDTVTLPNGMRLYLLEDHELPLINGTVLVRTGSLFDPPGKTGLAGLTAQVMVNGGSTNRAGVDLIRRFQDLGAEVDGSVTENSTSISISALKENGDEVLDTIKDLLTAPEFSQDRLDVAKSRLRNTIAHRNDDGLAILRREFIATVYGKETPYGAQVEYANVDRINRADLVSFYQRYFFPKNVMLALEGDFDAVQMKTRIEALFGDWKSEQPAVPEFPKLSTAGAPGKFLVVKKDAVQAFIAVGQLGGDYLDKDYPALQIMAGILGSGQEERLQQRLGTGADSLSVTWAAALGHPGLFEIIFSGNAFHTTQAIQVVMQALNRMRTLEVTDEELKTAKAAALNSLVFALDQQLSMMPRLLQYEYFHFPKDYTQRYQKALESVTRADVLRVARERLDPARMTIMVVANPTAFESPLESLGGTSVTAIDLTIPPSKGEAALGDPASQRLGKQLLARAQQAMGGADRLTAVTDYVQEAESQFDASAGGAQVALTERWMATGHLRQDSARQDARISVYCDGKTGWVASPQGSAVLSGVQLKQVQSDLFHALIPLLLSDRVPSRKVNSLDNNTVEISDAGQILKLVFDSTTGLLKNMLYDASTVDGPVSVTNTYSDYRDVGGLKLPYKVALTLAGKKYQETTIKKIQLNTGLKIQDLDKRP